MSEALIQRKRSESEQEIVLRLLEQVESEDPVSQDRFAKRLGIAKGLANAYFNRCLQKGWIKLRQVPKQRFLYYLTPKGFAEKARLSAQFLTHSYQFYREARTDLVSLMAEAARQGHKTLAVLGAGELAEITVVVSEESRVAVVGFVCPDSTRRSIAGRPVVASWSELGGAECALLATLEDTRAVLETFCADQPEVPIFIPKQLRGLLWKKSK
jgi:DNA-binding MarR family transcriptional regulator